MVGDSETKPAPSGSSSDMGVHLGVQSATRKVTHYPRESLTFCLPYDIYNVRVMGACRPLQDTLCLSPRAVGWAGAWRWLGGTIWEALLPHASPLGGQGTFAGEDRDHKETALSPWWERGDREAVGEGWMGGLIRHRTYESQYEAEQTQEP